LLPLEGYEGTIYEIHQSEGKNWQNINEAIQRAKKYNFARTLEGFFSLKLYKLIGEDLSRWLMSQEKSSRSDAPSRRQIRVALENSIDPNGHRIGLQFVGHGLSSKEIHITLQCLLK
jgi:hypothetical protein